MTSPPNQALHADRGRILFSRDTTSFQRPRRVNWVDYEAVEKSTHIQYILPISDTSLSISKT